MDNPQTIIVKQQKTPGPLSMCCGFTCLAWALLLGGAAVIGQLHSLFG